MKQKITKKNRSETYKNNIQFRLNDGDSLELEETKLTLKKKQGISCESDNIKGIHMPLMGLIESTRTKDDPEVMDNNSIIAGDINSQSEWDMDEGW